MRLIFLTFILSISNLCADSLTFSPFGFTYHYKDDYQGYPGYKFHPHAFDRAQQWTYHPEFNLIYKSKYMQYNVFWMRDSFDKHAIGGLLGPKYDVFKYLSIGLMLGAYAKQYPGDACYKGDCLSAGPAKVTSIKTEDFQIIPLVAATASIRLPLSKSLDFEINTAATPVLIHTVFGIRYNF